MRWLRPLRSSIHLTALSRTDRSVSVIQSQGFNTHTGNGNGNGNGGRVSRAWLAQMWKQEIRQWKEEGRRRGRVRKGDGNGADGDGLFGGFSGFQHSFLNWGAASAATAVTAAEDRGNATGAVSAERKLASLLSRTDLVVARDIEWANVLFAFEQESRYIIMDASAPHSPVGYIRETSNVIFRQLLRTRRPFIAHIIDSHGNEIFQVRRPFWLINSTIYAEVDGKEIGVVHRRWHLWRRIYDLYLGNKQFAVVENPGFWNWTFTLKDEEDNVLAQIDRNWRGIGLELFTDAGQYAIRFGGSGASSSVYNDSNDNIEKLEVVRPLTLPERAIALALAVSLDCDYFSRRGGWGLPIMILEE